MLLRTDFVRLKVFCFQTFDVAFVVVLVFRWQRQLT